ncbi:hypothetical protein HH308_11550 [Gordonia sp. TBRC 11910]|uniref:MmpS family membrane protein n=1 Tax=Gordonia asplenii TaxID=2725283 RepID=A0A848KT30_9ACTN|nr:MmpS family transport accessory protein [Gordonia asplenii]NMO01846.1 hypothetical protein [Gordonia asplenii]
MTQQPPQQPYPGQPGQPYPQQPYPAPPKKRKKWPWILLALVVVILALAGGCVAIVGTAVDSVDKQSKSTTTITYQVTGDGSKASITYTASDSNISQDTAASLPWSKDVTLTGFVKVASLTATNDFEADASSTIKCEVVVNGKVKFTNTAKGPGASASCSGSID